jgi:hypothetical protein
MQTDNMSVQLNTSQGPNQIGKLAFDELEDSKALKVRGCSLVDQNEPITNECNDKFAKGWI